MYIKFYRISLVLKCNKLGMKAIAIDIMLSSDGFK